MKRVQYDRSTNVFNLTFANGKEKQIPGTSHTLKCDRKTIGGIEEFLFYQFVA
jgi:hypothetical protein